MKSKILRHLIFQFILTIGFYLCFSLSVYASSQEIGPDFKKDLSIFDTKINYSELKTCGYISCIGKIKNSSIYVWEDLVIEVQYFNSNNELIDTVTEYNYDLVVPEDDEVAFRVRADADKDENEYHTHKVRITSASADFIYSPSNTRKNKAFFEIIISWTPMLLLIVVWIIFMRKYIGKKSPQKKIIEIQEKQYLLIEEQNKLFDKLIEVIDKK